MRSRAYAWFLLGGSLLALGPSCKARESADQDSRPLPTPEPPASAASPREDVAQAPKKRAVDDEVKEPSKPKRTADPAPPSTAAPAATAGVGGATTTTAAGGGASTPVPALPSAPVLAAPSAACLSRCQGAMQGCLSAPVDGGVPGFGNLDLCKKAFEACQSACKP